MELDKMKALATLLAALALACAGCGGAGDSGAAPTLPSLDEQPTAQETTTTTTEAVDPDEAFADYEACMAEHGLALPTIDADGDETVTIQAIEEDIDFEAWEEAEQACAPILEAAFGEFEMSPEEEAEFMDQQLEFAKCMRDNGVDWPDPTSDANAIIELPEELDMETLDAALQTCEMDVFGNEHGGVISGSADSSSIIGEGSE